MSAPEAIMRTAAQAAPTASTVKPSRIRATPQARRVMHPALQGFLSLQLPATAFVNVFADMGTPWLERQG
jgi:hypothetical protein